MNRWSLEARLLAASALLALVIAGAFIVLILALSDHRDATRAAAKSRNVTVEALTLQNLALDVGTGIRGYVLTGRESFLEPYREGRRELRQRAGGFEQL